MSCCRSRQSLQTHCIIMERVTARKTGSARNWRVWKREMLDWGSSFSGEMTWAGRRGELLVRRSLQDLIEEQHAGSSASLAFADVRSMLTYGQRNLMSPVSINTHTKHTQAWGILLNHSCCINTNRWSACPTESWARSLSYNWLRADHGSNDSKKMNRRFTCF